MLIIPNVTILALWSSEGKYFYNYGVDKMIDLWKTHLTSKYNNDRTWPFKATVELVDYKSDAVFVNNFLYNRLKTNIPSKISVIIAPEGLIGYNNAYLASKFNIPYIMTTTNPDPVYYEPPSQFNTSFFIKTPAMYIFRAIIDKYIQSGVKTIATVAYNDEYDGGYNYWSCYGAVTYLAVPKGIKYVASFNLFSNSTKKDVTMIAQQLQEIAPDAIIWCDWQSCTFSDTKSTDRFALRILKEINYMPKTFTFLDCFNTAVTNKYVQEGLIDYITESTFTHPNLKGQEYVEGQNPYANVFRSSDKITTVFDEINLGSNIKGITSLKYFNSWYKNVTGFLPTYKSNGYWAALDLIESAIYRVAKNPDFDTKIDHNIDSSEIMSMLVNSQVTGMYGLVLFDSNRMNTLTSSISVQLYPGETEPYIISPSSQSEVAFIYPIPNWSDRIYAWSLYKNHEFTNAVVFACICSTLLLAMIVTIIVHREESDIRMLHCPHMVAICVASMITIWSLVFLWQDDMNQSQCNSYLWGIYLPTSFIIQMMNMKAYRLSVYLHTSDPVRLNKITHRKMFIMTLFWTSFTLLYLIIATASDPPSLVKIVIDPYRPAYDTYYCFVGRTTTILTYLLVTKHIVFSIGCVLSIRNGTGEFRDGLVMKEAFVILWSCTIITYIMHFLGIGTKITYLLRVGFMSMALTMFCFRLLISRCYRHWFPDYIDVIFKRAVNDVMKCIAISSVKYGVYEDEITDIGLQVITLSSSKSRSFRGSLDKPIYSKTVPTTISLDDMYRVLANPTELDKFREIATKSLLVENVDFIMAVQKYHSKSRGYFIEYSKQINDQMKQDAKDCFKQFINIGSENEVNISSSTRSQIMKRLGEWVDHTPFCSFETAQGILDKDEFHHDKIFEKAYSEISIMLYQNLWNKYRSEQIEQSMC